MLQIHLGAGAAALALLSMTAQAWAGGVCAGPEADTALKVAAMQQELMVAALTCNETASYNGFVIAYRADLQRSDAALQAYFQHGDPHADLSGYHAFKTRLANSASLRSLRDITAYCAQAREIFDAALRRHDQPLAGLVTNEPAVVAVSDADCRH